MNPRRAKIICTIGPSSNSYKKIEALIAAGMDVARLNFSHGSHVSHAEAIRLIRKASIKMKKPVAILQDLQGPKIRVKTFINGRINLKNRGKFILTTRDIIGSDSIVSVTHTNLHKDVLSLRIKVNL